MQSTSDASAEAEPRPTVRSSLRRLLRGLMQARLSESLNSTRSSVSRGVDRMRNAVADVIRAPDRNGGRASPLRLNFSSILSSRDEQDPQIDEKTITAWSAQRDPSEEEVFFGERLAVNARNFARTPNSMAMRTTQADPRSGAEDLSDVPLSDDSLTTPANMRTDAEDFSAFHTAEEQISAYSGQTTRIDRGSAMRMSATSHSVNAEIEQNTATVTPQSVNMPAAQAAPKPKRVMIDAPRGQVPSPAPLFTSPGYGPPLRGRGGGKAGTVPGRKVYSINATAHTVGLSPGRFPSPTPDPPEMQIDTSDSSAYEDGAQHTSDRLRVAHAHAATAQVKRIAETAQLASMRFPRVGWKHDHVIRNVLREAGLILAQEIRNNHECCVYDSHELVQVTLERVIPDKGQAEYKRPEMQRGLSVDLGEIQVRGSDQQLHTLAEVLGAQSQWLNGWAQEVARLYEKKYQFKDSRNIEEEARALEDDDEGEDDDRDRLASNQYENMSDRHSEFSTSSSSKRRQESKEEALFRRQLTKEMFTEYNGAYDPTSLQIQGHPVTWLENARNALIDANVPPSKWVSIVKGHLGSHLKLALITMGRVQYSQLGHEVVKSTDPEAGNERFIPWDVFATWLINYTRSGVTLQDLQKMLKNISQTGRLRELPDYICAFNRVMNDVADVAKHNHYTMSEGDHDQFKKNFVDGLQEDIRTQLRQAINAKVVSEKPAREDRAFPMLHMYIESDNPLRKFDLTLLQKWALDFWRIRQVDSARENANAKMTASASTTFVSTRPRLEDGTSGKQGFTAYRKRGDSPAPFRRRINNTSIEEIDDGVEIEETDLAVYARYKQDGLLPEWTEEQKRRLLKEKLCFNCGQPNHRAKDCSERKADPASFTFNNLVLEEAEVSDDMGLPLN